MKNLLFLLVLALSVKGLSAQSDGPAVSQAPDPDSPVISFEMRTIDFGTIAEGTEQIRTFTFTNTGKSPLVITAIQGQCGCTTVLPESWSKDPIPPGGTATFKVKYDTTRIGMFDKKIKIFCNASNTTNGFFEVNIRGNVMQKVPGN